MTMMKNLLPLMKGEMKEGVEFFAVVPTTPCTPSFIRRGKLSFINVLIYVGSFKVLKLS
jgi:hypothetical protein